MSLSGRLSESCRYDAGYDAEIGNAHYRSFEGRGHPEPSLARLER
jgi:hypothetical protein